MAVASLVLGIVSLLLSLIGYGIIGGILGVLGIIFGASGMKDIETKGMATGGLVLSIIGAVLGLITFIVCTAACTALSLF